LHPLVQEKNSRPKSRDGLRILKKSKTCTLLPGTCKSKIPFSSQQPKLKHQESSSKTEMVFLTHTELLLKPTKILEKTWSLTLWNSRLLIVTPLVHSRRTSKPNGLQQLRTSTTKIKPSLKKLWTSQSVHKLSSLTNNKFMLRLSTPKSIKISTLD